MKEASQDDRGDDRSSSAVSGQTAAVREMLNSQVQRRAQERNKPALAQVRIETFKGSRSGYQDWRKTLEAQRALYRLGDEELAVLVYLSTSGEAREVVNQLEIRELQEPGGLGRVLKLLDDAYGSRSDERFEERQQAFVTYRRNPGVSIAAYLANLKRLRSEYLKEDPGTTLSDKSYAQRMLSRAGLSKKERMDIFFSAGGAYNFQRNRASNALQMLQRAHGGGPQDSESWWKEQQLQGSAQEEFSSKEALEEEASVASCGCGRRGG